MGLEALITDEEDETKLEYYVQDREEWTEYSYGFDGLDLILSKDGKSTRLKSFSMLYAEKKRMKEFTNGDMLRILQQDMMESFT